MDGKLGLILGLVAGAVVGAGGTFVSLKPAAQQELAAEPETIVVTQVVERAVVMNRPAQPEDRGPEGPQHDAEQMVAFTPQDEGPGGTNSNRRGRWPEPGTAEWSNRVAQFRAEASNRFAQFRADWSNRVVADRTNFIAKVKLNEDQATRFDVLTTAMNVRLAAILDPLVAQFQSGQFPRLSTEERTRLSHEVSGALVTTYDEMNRSMPSDWSSTASSNHVSLSHFVEPQYQMFVRGVTGGGRGGPGGFGGGFGGGRGGPPGGGSGGGGGGQPQPATR